MNADEAIERAREAEEKAINDACKALKGYDKQIKHCLAEIVASLCGVSVYDVLEDTTRILSKHARWFFWYAYKQMTNESCEGIAKRSERYRKFRSSTINSGISNMSMMIAERPIWAKRWSIVKRVINGINDVENKDITVKIKHPDGVKIEVKQE